MILINGERIKPLAVVFEIEADLEAHFHNFQAKYKNTFHYNLPNAVLDIVTKVNKKMLSTQPCQNEEDVLKRVESFAFG